MLKLKKKFNFNTKRGLIAFLLPFKSNGARDGQENQRDLNGTRVEFILATFYHVPNKMSDIFIFSRVGHDRCDFLFLFGWILMQSLFPLFF